MFKLLYTEIIENMYSNFKQTINGITDETISAWIEDLIFTKTYLGLKFQNEIFLNIANTYGLTYTKSNSHDEAKGIDGYLNSQPFSVKPYTYASKINKNVEKIVCPIIIYKKNTDNKLLKITFPIELRKMIS